MVWCVALYLKNSGISGRLATAATSARIFDTDHALLVELAKQTGNQHQEIIHEALATFHRDWMLDDINAAFGQLKRDGSAWREEQAERMERRIPTHVPVPAGEAGLTCRSMCSCYWVSKPQPRA